MPLELAQAVEIEGLARRYGVLPTVVAREPMALRKHVHLLRMAGL
jgi:hypothetical protein